jgi:hypothetical protein
MEGFRERKDLRWNKEVDLDGLVNIGFQKGGWEDLF